MRDWNPEDIAAFRKKYKLTRRALGELLGVTITSIYQWERGVRKPSKTAKILLTRIAEEMEIKKKGE
jgi:DNA-binding transcriptional regulator YiaG